MKYFKQIFSNYPSRFNKILLVVLIHFFLLETNAQSVSPEIFFLNDYKSNHKQFLEEIFKMENDGKLDECKALFLGLIEQNKKNLDFQSFLKWNYSNFLSRNIYNDEATKVLKEGLEEMSNPYKCYSYFSLANIYAERGKLEFAKRFLAEGTSFKNEIKNQNDFKVLQDITKSSIHEFEPRFDSSTFYLEKAILTLKDSLEENNYNKSFVLKLKIKIVSLYQSHNALLDGLYSIMDTKIDEALFNIEYDLSIFNSDITLIDKFCGSVKLEYKILKSYREHLKNLSYGNSKNRMYPGLESSNLRDINNILNYTYYKNPRKYLNQVYNYFQVLSLIYNRFGILFDDGNLETAFLFNLHSRMQIKDYLIKADIYKYYKSVLGDVFFSHNYLSNFEKVKMNCHEHAETILNNFEQQYPNQHSYYWGIYYFNQYKDLVLKKEKIDKQIKISLLEKSLNYFNNYKLKNKKAHPIQYLACVELIEFLKSNGGTTILDEKDYNPEYVFKDDLYLVKNYCNAYPSKKFIYLGSLFLDEIPRSNDLNRVDGLFSTVNCNVCGGTGYINTTYVNGNPRRIRCDDGCNWFGTKTYRNYNFDGSYYFNDHRQKVIDSIEKSKPLF